VHLSLDEDNELVCPVPHRRHHLREPQRLPRSVPEDKQQKLQIRYFAQLADRRSAKRLEEAVDFLIWNPIFTVWGLQAGLKLNDFKIVQRYSDQSLALEQRYFLRKFAAKVEQGELTLPTGAS
jgi:hypothetical protein